MNPGESEPAGPERGLPAALPTDDELERLLRTAAGDGSPDQSDWTERRELELVDAVTVLDTAADHPEGLRSAVGLDGRQIVAEGRGMTVVLDIATVPDGVLVSGELLDVADPVAIVQFVDPFGVEAGIAVCDAFGRFELVVEPGRYSLVVCTGALEVTMAVELA